MEKQSFKYLLELSKRKPIEVEEFYDEGRSVIGVVINSEKIYVPLRQVDSILNDQKIAPLAYTKDWFAGIVRHGSNFISVIDLANFPKKPEKKAKANVLICLADDHITGHYGLLVSRIEETITVVDLPARVEAEDTPYTLAYHLDNRVLQVLSLTKIVGSQAFAEISNF